MEMIEYNEAIKVLEKNIEQQKKTEEIHILDSYGYIVAEDVYSSISVPSFQSQLWMGMLYVKLFGKIQMYQLL